MKQSIITHRHHQDPYHNLRNNSDTLGGLRNQVSTHDLHESGIMAAGGDIMTRNQSSFGAGNNLRMGGGGGGFSDLGGAGGLRQDSQTITDDFQRQQSNISLQNQQQQQQQQQRKTTMFGKITDFFSSNNNNNNQSNNNNKNQHQQGSTLVSGRPSKSILSNAASSHYNKNNNDDGDDGAGVGGDLPTAATTSNLDKFLFSDADASLLFNFEAPSLSLLDLETKDVAMVELVNEMLRSLNKPVIPRLCQRVSLGDLPARFSRPDTTAAAVFQACSAPLVGDVAPHRCVFHSYVKRTLAQAKQSRDETSVSDIVQRRVYDRIDASHIVFHPSEPYAICCSPDEVLSVVSTSRHERRVFLSERLDRIIPNGVDEIEDFTAAATSRLNGGGHNDYHSSEGGDSYRTPPRFGGDSGGLHHHVGGGSGTSLANSNKRASGLVLIDAVYSHTVAVISSDSSVRIVTDFANRNGVRIAAAFPGLSSSSFDASSSASMPYYGSPVASPENTLNGGSGATRTNNKFSTGGGGGSATNNYIQNSLAGYQPLGQRLLITGDGHRYALWDIGQQRKIDERFALPPTVQQQITCVSPFSGNPESFVLGTTKSIIITDHRMKDATVGSLHIPQAFGATNGGCVSVMSHPGAQHKITGVSYSGLACVWDVRYSLDIGDSRAVLPGFGGSLQPGMAREAIPKSGSLPSTNTNNNNNNSSSNEGKISLACIHPLFPDKPLIAGCFGSKFKVVLPGETLAQRSDQPLACAWHPFEIMGAFTPWNADPSQRRLEIFAAAAKDQRADHIVDLI